MLTSLRSRIAVVFLLRRSPGPAPDGGLATHAQEVAAGGALEKELMEGTGDEEMGLAAAPPPKEASEMTKEQVPKEMLSFVDAADHTDRHTSNLKGHLNISFLNITVATGVLINQSSICGATKPLTVSPSLVVVTASAFVCLVSGIMLMLYTMKQKMASGPQATKNPSLCSKILLYVSTVSLVLIPAACGL